MEYTTIRFEQRERVGVVWLHRPEKLNAINATMYHELADLLDAIAASQPPIGALVITGSGRAFAAGADVGPYQTMTLFEFTAFQRLGFGVMERIAHLPCPVIAAVNGYAYGGGFELALACDVIIAAEDAAFALPEARLGLLPGGGGIQRLSRLVGPYIAKRMVLAAETISAQRAYELAIASQVTAPGAALDTALGLAQRMTTHCGPLTLRLGKRLIDEGLQASLPTALSMEMDSTALLFTTEDKREGLQAFIEKRLPTFTGR